MPAWPALELVPASARLSAQALLATDYFELRAADEQRRLLDATIQAFQASLTIAQNRFKAGIATQADIYAAHNAAKVLSREAASLYTSGQYVGLLVILILGILIATNEFSQQTATATFLATPKRERVVLSKIGAVAMTLASTLYQVSVYEPATNMRSPICARSV